MGTNRSGYKQQWSLSSSLGWRSQRSLHEILQALWHDKHCYLRRRRICLNGGSIHNDNNHEGAKDQDKILKELTATFQDEDKKGPNSKKRDLLTKSNIYMNQPDCSPFLNQITFSIQHVIWLQSMISQLLQASYMYTVPWNFQFNIQYVYR